MNVNDYAKKVLFCRDLGEKLRIAPEGEFIDFDPAPGIPPGPLDFLPGRPEDLVFTSARGASRIALPARPSLVNDRSRGILLHFFANHELLAAELMALALLKFPDAPEEFRRGLFETLREEQKHTLWYLGRMKECSVGFGEFPLSRFFWDTVSTMETPIDYVTRLSLTFEQANLDYSLHFGKIMEEAGDSRTARIMNRIYRDEISHVGYGLKWFRLWKKNGQSDWEAYRAGLTLPLSPSRAKGNGAAFNEAGRREAGLTDEFVRQLAVYEKSRGRTPNLFFFNPDAEDIIAAHLENEDYRPGEKVRALVRDLEILQIFLARQDDVVLMRKPPSLEHLERLKKAGFQLPEIVPFTPEAAPGTEFSSLSHRKLNAIRPWSAAPDLPRVLGPVAADPALLWREAWGSLFSKCSQACEFAPWMGGAVSCSSLAEARAAIERIAAGHGGGVVLKRSHSAAGRGVRFFEKAGDAWAAACRWLESGSAAILVEPLHQRVLDFSVQFEIHHRGGIRRLGFIRQLIDSRGRYRGSISGAKFCKGLDANLSHYLMERAMPVYEEAGELAGAVRSWADRFGYAGPLGIDAYLYREGGELELRPVCEINPRHTMGRVAHELRRFIASGHSLCLALEKAGPRHREMRPEMEAKSGRICGGEFCLNEMDADTQFAAVLRVSKTPDWERES